MADVSPTASDHIIRYTESRRITHSPDRSRCTLRPSASTARIVRSLPVISSFSSSKSKLAFRSWLGTSARHTRFWNVGSTWTLNLHVEKCETAPQQHQQDRPQIV